MYGSRTKVALKSRDTLPPAVGIESDFKLSHKEGQKPPSVARSRDQVSGLAKTNLAYKHGTKQR